MRDHVEESVHNISELLLEVLNASAGSCGGGSKDWGSPLGFLVSPLALVTPTWPWLSCHSLCAAAEAQGQCVPYNHSLLSSASLQVLQTERRQELLK